MVSFGLVVVVVVVVFNVVSAQNTDYLCLGPEHRPNISHFVETQISPEDVCIQDCLAKETCSSMIITKNGPNIQCSILDTFNDNVLSEEIDVGDGNELWIKIKWEENEFFMRKPRFYDAAEEALKLGFTYNVTIASLKTKRFLMLVSNTSDIGLDAATRRCAQLHGTMLHEYNQEVSDALKAAFGSDLPNPRYQGIRIAKMMDDSLVSVWPNGMVDWGQDETGTCGKYQTWTSTNWVWNDDTKYSAYVQDDIATNGLVPGTIPSGSEPTTFLCQFAGKNLATNKRSGSKTTFSLSYPSRFAVDGNWFASDFFRAKHTAIYQYWWVDLDDVVAVKSVQVSSPASLGERTHNLHVWLGFQQPSGNLDRSKYTLCGQMPYKFPVENAFFGVTCRSWTAAQYVVLENHSLRPCCYYDFSLVEVGIYGIPLSQF